MNSDRIAKLWDKKIMDELNRKPLFIRTWKPKFKWFPKTCMKMRWGYWESEVSGAIGEWVKVNTIKFRKLYGVDNER